MRTRILAPALLLVAVAGCASGTSGASGRVAPPTVGDPPRAGQADAGPGSVLPVWEPEYAQEVRATVGTFPPIEGEVRAITGGVLLLLRDSETVPLRLNSIRILEVRKAHRTRALEGGVMGAVVGAVLGRVTLLGIGGKHWETQGRTLAPGLGALMGGLAGSLLGWNLGGDYWEAVTIPPSATLAPRRYAGRKNEDRESDPSPGSSPSR